MIKVLHTEWSDGWGGQEIRILNEMLGVRNCGIEVILVCREYSQIKEKALLEGIKVFTLPFRGNTDLKTLWNLIKIIKIEKVDIVNTHSGKDTWVGGLAAKFAGVKFIRTRHLSNPIRSNRVNFINELADYIFTTGESVKDDMIQNNRINPNKIMSVPTGIDSTKYNPENYNPQEYRKLYNIQDGDVAIGIIAVLREFKKHEVFLEMAKMLVKQNAKIKFFIAGDGPRKDIIKKLIIEYNLTENITMLGHISEPEKLLSALDIFVLTSDSKEGVPQSVTQALMMNTCVIATDVGSIKDLYNDENFFLVEPNSPEKIYHIINELLDNPSLLKQYKQNSRNYVFKHFSKKTMVTNILEIYKLLCSEK
jgi:glycosyltransferase involved in cell wall biosynthesis